MLKAFANLILLLAATWIVSASEEMGDASNVPGGSSPVALERVQITATRKAHSIHDTAAAVSVVDGATGRDLQSAVSAETLRGAVGAYFQQTTPGQGIPIVRGLKGSQVLHLVDGMRLNNAFFRNAPNQYLGLVDAYGVDHYEVVRGPSSTLYGSDAMGGVVQIITPETRFHGDRWNSESEFFAGFSSADLAETGHLRLSVGRDDLSLSVGATWQSHQDRRVGGGERIGPADYRSRAADFKLLYAPNADSEWMFSVQYMEQPDTPRVDELRPGFGRSEPAASIFSFAPNSRKFGHLRYRRKGLPFADQLEIHLAQQRITDDRRTRDFGSDVLTREHNRSRLNGITVQLDTTLSADHSLSYGVEVYHDQVFSTRSATDLPSGVITPVTSRFPDASTMRSVAVYGFEEWRLSSRWTLGGGLRYSHFDIRLPGDSAQTRAHLTPHDLTGNLSLAFALNDELHLVANAGRGFRPPNIFDLGNLGERPGNRFNIANPRLRPESLRSLDLGVKWSSTALQAELFGFYSDYDNKITTVLTGELTNAGRDVVTSANVGQTHLYGIESGFRYFSDWPLELYAVANWVRGTERNGQGPHEPADRIPPMNGRLGLRTQFWTEWIVDAWLGFADRQDRLSRRDRRDVRIDPNGTGGWTTVNIRAHWTLTTQWEMGLLLGNLLDKKFREHGSGIDASGFNVALSMSWFY